mgnify:CR=1 FL=1
MDGLKNLAVLFDLDGVVVDTETQYTQFWDAIGEQYLNKKEFGRLIKGTTLKQIYEKYFHSLLDKLPQIEKELNDFEGAMSYDFIDGVEDFIAELKENKVPSAIVTSSNAQKMSHVYRAHPQLPTLFDAIFTAEDFSKSKPEPDCYLKGMAHFNREPRNTFVFEDSLMGLKAGAASGAWVVGITTTLPKEKMEGLAVATFPDFTEINVRQMMEIKERL